MARRKSRKTAARRKLDRKTPALPQAAASLAAHRVVRPPEMQTLLGFRSRQGLWRAIKRGDIPKPVKHRKTQRVIGWPEDVVRGLLGGASPAA